LISIGVFDGGRQVLLQECSGLVKKPGAEYFIAGIEQDPGKNAAVRGITLNFCFLFFWFELARVCL